MLCDVCIMHADGEMFGLVNVMLMKHVMFDCVCDV